LGDLTTTDRPAAVIIPKSGALTGKVLTKVRTGANHNLMLDNANALYAFGSKYVFCLLKLVVQITN